MIAPLRARRSTVLLFQKERRVPVSFSFPIVCRAPLREKKLVSPEKNAPFTGRCSSAGEGVAGDSNAAAFDGCESETGEAETGALHHASVVAPAAEAISAVSVALFAGASAGCAHTGSSAPVGSCLAPPAPVSSGGHTGALQLCSGAVAACSSS